MDLDTERLQEPAKSLRRKRVEINFELRKVFEQAGILLGLRRGRGNKPFELRLDAGEFQTQLFHLLLDALEELSVGVARAPQRDGEVCHVAVEFSQLLPKSRRRHQMFVTDEVACGGQAKTLPAAPAGHCPPVRRAWRYLVATHDSVGGLLDSFIQIRDLAVQAKIERRGRLRSDELNLLRAALVFTSSGLDACCQQLLRDALPPLVGQGGTAELKFREYLKIELHAPRPSDGFLDAIAAADPRAQLVERYVAARTKASFQGSTDLLERVRDILGIPNKVLPKARFVALDGFFTARNDIVHRLDYEAPASSSVKRHHRNPQDVSAECDTVLLLIADLIHATTNKLKK